MDTKTRAMLNIMAQQRNTALDMVVQLHAQVVELEEKLAANDSQKEKSE